MGVRLAAAALQRRGCLRRQQLIAVHGAKVSSCCSDDERQKEHASLACCFDDSAAAIKQCPKKTIEGCALGRPWRRCCAHSAPAADGLRPAQRAGRRAAGPAPARRSSQHRGRPSWLRRRLHPDKTAGNRHLQIKRGRQQPLAGQGVGDLPLLSLAITRQGSSETLSLGICRIGEVWKLKWDRRCVLSDKV